MLSSFVGALGLFGENLGRIEEINIKGLDVEMIIVYKYNLIFVAILDKEFLKYDIREEAEKSLDMFYSLYRREIEENCNEVSQFTSFKNILFTQIEEYFNRIKEKSEVKNFGFFTDAINKLRTNSTN